MTLNVGFTYSDIFSGLFGSVVDKRTRGLVVLRSISKRYKSNSFNQSELVVLNPQIPESPPTKKKITKANKDKQKPKGQVCKTVYL